MEKLKSLDRRARILIVEDDRSSSKLIKDFLGQDHEMFVAENCADAVKLIAQSLQEKKPFNLVILDLVLGENENGESIGRRIIDVIGAVNVLVMTGYPSRPFHLSFQPDGVIIKPFNRKTIVSMVERLISPLRHNRSEDYSVLLDHWLAASELCGFEGVRFHSEVFDETDNVKKMTLQSADEEFINCVSYEQPMVESGVVNVGVSSLIGCPIRCLFCKNWRKSEVSISQGRRLTTAEIVAQVHYAMMREQGLFKADSGKRMVVNFTVEGDALYNLDNCAEAIRQLSRIKKPETSFIITSVGNVKSLKRYYFDYIDLPRVRHYWSVISLVPETRAILMPGTKGQSLEKMRDYYEIIARATGQKVTVSWSVIKGVNDRQEDAEMIAKFFGGRPFEVKLMALCKGSLSGIETSHDDVKLFGRHLRQLDVPFRIRKILGSNIQSGCGNTKVHWK